MKIIFISLDKEFIYHVSNVFDNIPDITTIQGDIREISLFNKAFVSPANSMGFMDGGIDYVLSRIMFPGIETKVKNKINEIGKHTLIGRSYLPIGSAIVVPTQYLTCCLISAPTMFLPHDVSMTKNAYHAFMASLCMFDKYRKHTEPMIDTLVCTSLCCGWGKMSPLEAASQMFQAYIDFIDDKRPSEISHLSDPFVFMTYPRDEEQPKNYDNREIMDIL